MPAITKPVTREIIEDFAAEIQRKKRSGVKPSMTVINFRTEMKDGTERPVEQVPLECLRYRKDNGRIMSDVLDYERQFGPLDEKDDYCQEIVHDFLKKKDPEKTEALHQTIMHAGQREPAIITYDGFLINGNRRKMVLDALHKDFPSPDA